MTCKICNLEYKGVLGLSIHIKKIHNIEIEQYYLKYLGSKKFCIVCGKVAIFKNLTQTYKNHCSKKCSTVTAHKHTIETNLKKYGVENVFSNKAIQQKIKQTTLSKYGCQSTNQSEIIKQKMKKTMMEKYGVQHALQCDESKQKCKATTYNKFGVENVFQLQNVQKKARLESSSQSAREKRKYTNIKRYGHQSTNQSEIIKQKIKNTFLNKYGGHPFRNQDQKLKIKQNNVLKYGYQYPSQRPQIKAKIKQTNLIKYGGHPMQNRDIFKKSAFNKKQIYQTENGKYLMYQSKSQLRFIKYCEYNNIEIQNGDIITYQYLNKIHKYFVDFKIKQDDTWQLIEIKQKHPWFEMEKQSGVLLAKILAAQRYSNNHNYKKYRIIMTDSSTENDWIISSSFHPTKMDFEPSIIPRISI